MDTVRRVWVAVFAGTLAASCAGTTNDGVAVSIDREVDVAGVTVTDIHFPTRPAENASGYPLVVMLHGGDGDPADMTPLAEAVAARGAVVHVPTWPVVRERRRGAELDAAYREQVEAVVCVLRTARDTAAVHGADPDDLTLVGHSAGGFVGAAVAMVDEPPWPGIDCLPDVDHRPQRFVGISGDYTGSTMFSRDDPAVSAAYDPFTLPVTNRNLEVRLVHGFADDTIWPDVAIGFRDRLVRLGIDARILALDVGHGAPRSPTGVMEFVADQIVGLLQHQPTAFEPERSATLAFAGDRCTYDGPEQLGLGESVTIEIRNEAEVGVYFVFVAFVEWRPGAAGVELDGRPWVRDVDPPDDAVGLGFFRIDAGESTQIEWAFADGGRPWMLLCLPHTDHRAAGWMHPAAELVPLGGPEQF